MTIKQQYRKIHKLAKLVIFALVVLLLVINRVYNLLILDILAVALWFFGVNTVAYIIEHVLNLRHTHDKV
jgi:hypothetical protein